MAEANVADGAEKPVIATPVAGDEQEDAEEGWRIQAEAFKSEGMYKAVLLRSK